MVVSLLQDTVVEIENIIKHCRIVSMTFGYVHGSRLEVVDGAAVQHVAL